MWDDHKYELVAHGHPTRARRVHKLFFYLLFIRLYMLPQRAFVIKLCTCGVILAPSLYQFIIYGSKSIPANKFGLWQRWVLVQITFGIWRGKDKNLWSPKNVLKWGGGSYWLHYAWKRNDRVDLYSKCHVSMSKHSKIMLTLSSHTSPV